MQNSQLDSRLRKGLYRWRDLKLQKIELSLEDARDDYTAASEGLGIAHRNPGEVAEDVIEYLWEKLNNAACELTTLEAEHEWWMSLTLPQLATEFARRQTETK